MVEGDRQFLLVDLLHRRVWSKVLLAVMWMVPKMRGRGRKRGIRGRNRF
jgi:hypothetical protein